MTTRVSFRRCRALCPADSRAQVPGSERDDGVDGDGDDAAKAH